jgi:hypothetical protein
MDISLSELIEIIVVNGCNRERFITLIWKIFGFFNVFQNEFAKFGDQILKILQDPILEICSNLFDHILLGCCVATKKISNSTEKYRISKLDIIQNVLFQ